MILERGSQFIIEVTRDGVTSRKEAIAQVPGSKVACIAQLNALIKRFADMGSLKSPVQMCPEEDGFYAIKTRCGLRAYGWYHSTRRRVFVISHFIMKKKQKLDPRDIDRAKRNRDEYEEAEDE